MNDIDRNKVHCGTHGVAAPAYVCSHILQTAGAPAGFNEPDADPDDPDLEALCDACDAMCDAQDGWTDAVAAFADVRLVCEFCFARLRERQRIDR